MTISPENTEAKANAPEFLGSWFSPRCDGRDYTRQLELKADGTFLATDLVSPCPEGAQCIWSGIVSREGSWRLDRGRIELTTESEQDTGRARPLPGLLDWDQNPGTLIELVVGGPMSCDYQRMRSQVSRNQPP